MERRKGKDSRLSRFVLGVCTLSPGYVRVVDEGLVSLHR